MTKSKKDLELDERLRELIEERYGNRGRFTLLEEVSQIGAQKWKNFYYQKQSASEEMLGFWCKKYAQDEQWLLTGVRPPRPNDFPFAAMVPGLGSGSTVGQRLNWAIGEWASPKGADLFRYLEERSKGAISADDWAKVILRMEEPTVAMIQVVCTARPMFTEWIIRGKVSPADTPQVDPDDEKSVADWKRVTDEARARFFNTWKHAKKDSDN